MQRLAIPDVMEIRPDKFGDERGYFSETYNERDYHAAGIEVRWVQDNHSLSVLPGTLRGLHYQLPPFAQDKLVRVSRGRVFDVAVDIRRGSNTYGKWISAVLSAEEWNQLFIPKGFAHGFLTLEPHTEFLYKVSAPYSAEHDRSIRFDDPDLAISWPSLDFEIMLSKKDIAAPLFRDAENIFEYER